MTKLAYLQCPTGISGDMFLGTLVSLGVPIKYLTEKLNGLGIEHEYQFQAELVSRNGQQATKVHINLLDHGKHTHHHGRHLPEIEEMICKSGLPPRAETWSLQVFQQLAVAEGAVHGIAPEKVHFHEVGAVDAIVDIVGTCLGLDWLNIDSNEEGLPQLYCSALPIGGGTVHAAHGEMAVPVPAVLKLWEMRGCPVYSNGIERELVTPTGAAIVTALAVDFGSPPPMNIQQVGLGAGSLNLVIPNILRLWLGMTTAAEEKSYQSEKRMPQMNLSHPDTSQNPKSKIRLSSSPYLETISILETQIDDLSPQAIGYVFEALFAAGAMDVFTQSIGMKKSRPGILLSVICHPENLLSCETILFRETTTLGIRRSTQQRAVLQREIQQVETKYGAVHIKVAWMEQAKQKVLANAQPEYEDCAELARKHQVPWYEVQQVALQNWRHQQSH